MTIHELFEHFSAGLGRKLGQKAFVCEYLLQVSLALR